MLRRSFLVATGATALTSRAFVHAAAGRFAFGDETFARDVERLAAASGGRMGVAVLDMADGARFGFHAGERFPMCSTFKLPLAALLLSRVDRGEERLDREVDVPPGLLLDNSPALEAYAGRRCTIEALCAAALRYSDNTAANLLLDAVGGPPAVTFFMRTLGDPVTRLDRMEPDVNDVMPGDPRDTTSPDAMLQGIERLLFGEALRPASRKQLGGWMAESRTGAGRMKAGLPTDWQVADRTGASSRGVDNEVAVLRPPGRPPLIVASFIAESPIDLPGTNALHARLGSLIARQVA